MSFKYISNAFFLLLISIQTYAQEPSFEWAISNSGLERKKVHSIAVDSFGNIYLSGAFEGNVDFNPGPDSLILLDETPEEEDIFIQKLNAEGSLLWVRQIERKDHNPRCYITVDSIGNVFSTGFFKDTVDFDPGPGITNLISTAATNFGLSQDFFIQKLDTEGNFEWIKQIGGVHSDLSRGITTDIDGNILITGYFRRVVDFDPGPNEYLLEASNNGDHESAFILKIDTQGEFIWAKHIDKNTEGDFITTDAHGNIYVIGHFSGTRDFDPGPDSYFMSSTYDSGFGEWTQDVFILKLNADGNFLWARDFGTESWDRPITATVRNSENVYITGSSDEIIDLDPGQDTFYMYPMDESEDMFVVKLDATGEFIWANQIGGNGYDRGESIILDDSENIFITGSYRGIVDFDSSQDTFLLESNGESDAFILKIDSLGNFHWVKNIGGIAGDAASLILIDHFGEIITAGSFNESVDFNIGVDSFIISSSGFSDIFILKLNSCGLVTNISSDIGFEICQGESLTLTATGGNNYLWNTGDTTSSISVSPLTNSVFSVEILSDTLDCIANEAVEIIVHPLPTSQFDFVIDGNTVDFINLSDSTAQSFEWDFGDNSTSLENNPNHTYLESGVHNVQLISFNDCGSDTISQNIEIIISGNKSLENKSNIQIYPNPTSDMLTIESEEDLQSIQIFNMLGQEVLKKNTSENTEILDLSHFPLGVYTIKVINKKDEFWSSEFIKQ